MKRKEFNCDCRLTSASGLELNDRESSSEIRFSSGFFNKGRSLEKGSRGAGKGPCEIQKQEKNHRSDARAVFDNEGNAYKGKEALQLLNREGGVHLYAYAVVTKNPDGTATVKQSDDASPLGMLAGTQLEA